MLFSFRNNLRSSSLVGISLHHTLLPPDGPTGSPEWNGSVWKTHNLFKCVDVQPFTLIWASSWQWKGERGIASFCRLQSRFWWFAGSHWHGVVILHLCLVIICFIWPITAAEQWFWPVCGGTKPVLCWIIDGSSDNCRPGGLLSFWRHLSFVRKLPSLCWKRNYHAFDCDHDTMVPWLIQAHGSVCKCVFILVKVVNINNAHRGLSSDCLLAKFNMKAAFTCCRICNLVLFHPFLPLNGSDRGMWPINSNWRSYGDWVSLWGSSIDPRGGGAGQAVLQPPQLLTPPCRPSCKRTLCPFTRTIIRRAGHPSALTDKPLKHNYTFCPLSAWI